MRSPMKRKEDGQAGPQTPMRASAAQKESQRQYIWYIGLMILAFLIRLVLAVTCEGHETDMGCWQGWADRVYSDGFSGFYTSGGFADYPPGYVYVLWIVGMLRNLVGAGTFSDLFLVKLPAILCDLITAKCIYDIAKERSKERFALFCAGLYLFSPAILLNSAVWGQVDSVLTVFIVLVCYFIYKRKLPQSYVAFVIGFLIKPQMAFVFPIVVCAIIEQVFMEQFEMKKMLKNLLWGLGSIAGMVLSWVPFGVSNVWSQYMDTMASYPNATVNAYNIWAMAGKNWCAQTDVVLGLQAKTWGTLFIAFIIMAAILLWLWKKNDDSKVFYVAAFLLIGIFTLSVRMHERYMFPALALILILYAIRPKRSYFWMYILFSVLHFLNVYDVYKNYDASNFDWENPVPVILGAMMVIAFAIFTWLGVHYYASAKAADEVEKYKGNEPVEPEGILPTDHNTVARSEKLEKLTKVDIIAMVVITLLYAILAFVDLGDMVAPETGWYASHDNINWDAEPSVYDEFTLDFGETVSIQTLRYYVGNYNNPKFTVLSSADGEQWTPVLEEADFDSVFCWHDLALPATGRYLKFECNSYDASIWEMVFLDGAGNQLLPVNASQYPELFDEQELCPERTTNLNSTYFDEIYHARTAYEFTQDGVYCYENTHPPLGKVFISLGIRMFGMNPFGWRCVGTFFGVMMIPFLYLLAKELLKKSWAAIATTLLFTFDFMHFVQTRISTIDVYITFFVIVMYYFMYRYVKMSFYDTNWKKTLVPLTFSGIAMGLGVASKWTGVYAGIGLGILFFVSLYKRYREYLYAKENPDGSTNGISHQHILNTFWKETYKTIVWCILFFVVVPVVIYTLSYIPFYDGTDAGLIARMLKNQESMFSYHSGLVSEHFFASKWCQWPLMTKPMWFYSGSVSETVKEGITTFGNPLVWWAGIPAFLYMLYLVAKKRDKRAMFLSLGYMAQYLPWFFIGRTTYIYHYFPSVPFVTLMLGYSFLNWAKEKKERKTMVFVYVAAAIGLFILFYPVLSGHGVERTFVNTFLKWFDSWYFVS